MFLTETKCKIRRLMENSILNFHFVFRNTSLMVKKKQDSQYILYYTWHKDEKNSNLLWKMVVILMGSLF